MKSRPVGIVLVCLTLVLFIAVQAPAKLLAIALQQHYPDVRVASVSGTFWHGRAYGLTADIQGHQMSLSKLSWQLYPMSLLTLTPTLYLEGELGQQNYRARLSPQVGGGLRVEGLQANVPAQLLSNSAGFALSGQINAEVAELAVSDGGITQLEGRIVWQQAAINAGGAGSQLGSFTAQLAPNADGALVATWFDLGGALELNSTVVVDIDGDYRMDGVVALRDPGNSALQHWLQLVGEEIGTGGDGARRDGARRNGARNYRIAPQGKAW